MRIFTSKIRVSFLLLALIFCTSGLRAQDFSFSDSVEISLLTCSPGPQVYAKFGHSGIRVLDKQENLDLVFNWGLFSFETSNFYVKFLKGETDYMLGALYTKDFLNEYKQRNSVVWEQVLNLTALEKKQLLHAILENYKPENRKYRYNFVFDNCATRPRDLIMSSIDGHISYQNTWESQTYRHAIGEYIGHETWLRFGIDLIFGYQADNNMPQLQSMFLPEILKIEFVKAKKISSASKAESPLIKESNTLVSSVYEEPKPAGFLDKPFQIFLSLLIFVFLLSAYEFLLDKKYNTYIDSALLLVTGAAGTIIFFLMFFSVHPLVKLNFNILWLNPLNLIAGILILFKKFRIPVFIYQLINLIFVVLALISVAISVQTFNQTTFVIIAILIIRYASWIYRTKKRIVRKLKFRSNSN